MSRAWITNSSTNVEAMVNSINAACDTGFVPTHLHVLENPDVEAAVSEALAHVETIVDAYDGEPPEIHLTSLDDEVEFGRIRDHHRDAIEEADERGDEVAVDRRIEELRTQLTREELVEGIQEMKERLQDFRETYDVEVLAEYGIVQFRREGQSKQPFVPYERIEFDVTVEAPVTGGDTEAPA